MQHRKIRMGMIGGGTGAFIGSVHRIAARLDGHIELVCGAFSSSHEKSMETGQELYLQEERVYTTWQEMILQEAQRKEGDRMDMVSIVTPNHLHAAPAIMALEHGFAVICDKPLCLSTREALEIKEAVKKSGLPFALTHTYTGYPMVKQARHMIASGELGPPRKVVVEYPQGWLTEKLEDEGQKQAAWRSDPAKAGKAGAYGDIGTHAANMAEYVSGLQITKVLSQMSKVVEGRLLDDDSSALLEFEGGVPGVLICSQVSAGEENALKVKVYGTKGGVEWCQEDENTLLVKRYGAPNQIYRTGFDNSYLAEAALVHARVPSGHPEGYLEAFANIYRNFAMAVRAHFSGSAHNPVYDFPDIDDGVHGMALVDAMVESTSSANQWIEVAH
ncbi:MAG: Gfo/Idh/MocA family oxidoreductase [Balneolaceae bacterium]|nr:Gfo/Idh/MocA family oxidoreductase [Balneolaceae bacterium]